MTVELFYQGPDTGYPLFEPSSDFRATVWVYRNDRNEETTVALWEDGDIFIYQPPVAGKNYSGLSLLKCYRFQPEGAILSAQIYAMEMLK